MVLLIFIVMSKKKVFTSEEVKAMISKYNDECLGTPSIGKLFGVSKEVVNRVLRENGVALGGSGRKFKGGKSESDKRYYTSNKDKIREYNKEWQKENRESIREYHSNWRDENREELRKKQNESNKKRIDGNPQLKLHRRISSALFSNLKENGVTKNNRTLEILGFTIEELMSHIESLFTDGMTWDNYGEWHIDHIQPMTSFSFTDTNDFDFKRCWGLNNLQPLWATNRFIDGVFYEGNLNKGNVVPKTCYQHRVNQINKTKEIKSLPFDYNQLKLKDSEFRVINKQTARDLINKHEWLGFMPNYTKYHFGLYFKVDGEDYLAGVVTFQDDYGKNTGVWDKYDYTDKILLLSRGVGVWWSPKNTASYLISKALHYLNKNTNYKVITATVDNLAGEVGTVYQASNWDYVGVMDGNILPNGKERTRLGVIIDDNLYTSRQIRSMLGTMKKSVILENYPEAIFIQQKAKDRYFRFIGSKKEICVNRSKIQGMLKKYPKRLQ